MCYSMPNNNNYNIINDKYVLLAKKLITKENLQ